MKFRKRGFGFGLVSGVITTLGVMIGLYSVTHSKLVVLGGILSVAIADSFSDALGIHISEESARDIDHSLVWKETFSGALKSVFLLTIKISKTK